MMSQYKDLSIPVSVIGPGSQPDEGGVLEYMSMPNDMSIFNAPVLMDYSLENYPHAVEVIDKVSKALHADTQAFPITIDFSTIPEADLDFLNKFLGEGEVSVLFNQDKIQCRIQETVLAGVWRIASNESGKISHAIEVGYTPSIVIQKTFKNANQSIQLPETMPEGVINAPSLLTELSEKSSSWQAGDEAHIVNLTLLPQSPQDLDMLGEYLQEGPTIFLSRGYGSCRVSSTKLKNTWWVQYFNSEDKLILNTLEISDVPIVTQASQEDIIDSQERIQEMLESIQ